MLNNDKVRRVPSSVGCYKLGYKEEQLLLEGNK